jgi:archaellum component FlaG (FlaF/FlaG flagellin family)
MRKQNYNNKSKNNMDEKKLTGTQSVPSLFANISKEDGDSIYMVNSHQVDIGSSSTAYELYVKHVGMAELHSSNSSVNDLLDGQLQDMIDAYSTARGYVTGVTVAKVEQYLQASERILSLITYLHKAQNGNRFQTDSGFNLGATLGSRPDSFTTSAAVAGYIGDDTDDLATLINDGGVSISNSVWSGTYLSLLSRVKLPRATVSYVLSMFGVNYTFDQQGSYIVSFIPNFMINTDSAATLIAAQEAVLDGLRSTDPDIVDIMHFLGFTSDLAVAIDFARDQRQLTVPLVHDEFINGALVNGYVVDGQVADADVTDMFIDTTGVYSAINNVDAADFNANAVFLMLLIRDKNTVAHYQIELFKSGANDSVSGYDLPYVVQPDGITVSTFDAATMGRVRRVLEPTIYGKGPKIPYTDIVSINDIGGGSYSLSGIGSPSTQLLESPSTFKLPREEFDYYTEAKFADMIMGDVKWRVAIQELTNKIRPRSITRSE